MADYDESPGAYEHFLRTQNRVANWVLHTEHHRPTFEAAAPGAPGLPPAPRPQSPPFPSLFPPSPSSSEASCVHTVPIRRSRPPPPPIYAPRSPFPVQPYPSPVGVRVHGDHPSHSHSHRLPPPLVTPIKPPRIHETSQYGQPLTSPTSSSASTSLGNLHPDLQASPDHLRQHHHRHTSTNTLPGLEPPYISRHALRAYHSHHCDCHDCSRRHHHPYLDHSRRNIKSISQLNSQTRHIFPPQMSTYRDYAQGGLFNSVNYITSVPVGIPVPPRYPVENRALA